MTSLLSGFLGSSTPIDFNTPGHYNEVIAITGIVLILILLIAIFIEYTLRRKMKNISPMPKTTATVCPPEDVPHVTVLWPWHTIQKPQKDNQSPPPTT